jgi:hypothetical protein
MNQLADKKTGALKNAVIDSDRKLWGLFFLYPFFASIFVQLILLRYIFPQWNAGEGMLVGGDWLSFHQLAVALADKINHFGWSAWVLRPANQAPAGIAAIFYVLIAPKPWVMIPLNAALHATAAFTLVKILTVFTNNKKTAILAALPFWLYPSALTWYAQIHKDGYFIAGFLLFVFGWMLILQIERHHFWLTLLRSTLFILSGAFLIWVVRIYSVEMIQGVGFLALASATIIFLYRASKKKLAWMQAGITSLVLLVVMVAINPRILPKNIYTSPAPASSAAEEDVVVQVPPVLWRNTSWPGFIENRAFSLSITREGYRLGYPNAGSNVDVTIAFHQVSDLIFYLPRAAELGFLAPFPVDWFGQGSQGANTIMRRISGFEMIGIYAGLFLLPLAIWRWRKKPELWCVLLFCIGMIMIYALVVANIGTLYRFRYGFIMTLVGLGLAAGISTWQDWRTQKV